MPAVLDPATSAAGKKDAVAIRADSLWMWIATALIAVAGVALRVCHWTAFTGKGFDEALYAHYLSQLLKVGLGGYPDIVDGYLAVQKTLEGSILPPTRFLYIFCAYVWHGLFGGEPLACFYAVSRVFSVGVLALAGGFAWRLLPDRRMALGVFALMAFSPLQIHMAQHALADGFFEFFVLMTLWALWECLQRPSKPGWLTMYTAGLALMVTTKENAFFVFVAVVGLLIVNRWMRFGKVDRWLLVATFAGPLIGVAVLTNLAGGLRTLLDVYLLGVPKNMHLQYAILTGDGPWYRYWIDLLTVSPLVFVLACGMIFQLRREQRPLWFAATFIAASYALMANVKYGMNLRYATMWDFSLRALAMGQVTLLVAGRLPLWAGIVAGLCAFDLWQYYRLAVLFPLYELVPNDLLHALKMLK